MKGLLLTGFMVLTTLFPVRGERGLVSPESGVNYEKLARYLEGGDWRRANEETRDLLLAATGRKMVGWMRLEDIRNIPCWDLKTIDRLWYESSRGLFGLRTQLKVFLETGNRPGKLTNDENYNRFGEKVGWRRNNDWIIFIENLDYSLNAPRGHLPNIRSEYSIGGGRLYYTTLAERLVQCNMGKN
ncbi:MAG: GUN4 domain-containing protein [Geminocystis sp.]|nr:GUN4 domain-containing protein [Geminocystis sp.]MCS7146695.1 GUN4 domain-containing protein [Geminocystis sp.]MDW8115521.1 GUN4 domain-containing protein [Geminocystis sp.]MDW8463063.1 GUN4 domain-containing protein [Geminocystis sp.]